MAATNGDQLILLRLVLMQFSTRSCDNEEVIELAPVQNDYTLLVRKFEKKKILYKAIHPFTTLLVLTQTATAVALKTTNATHSMQLSNKHIIPYKVLKLHL